MMNNLMTTYEDIDEINIGTVFSNKRAVEFYEKSNFKVIGYSLRWERE